MAREPRLRDRAGRGSARPLPDRATHRSGSPLGRVPPVHGDHRLRQHDPKVRRRAAARRARARAPAALDRALERARHGGEGQPGLERARRAHRDLRLRGDALRRWLQPFLPRADRDAWRRSGVFPGPQLAGDLRARLPRGTPHGGAAAALPPGGGRRRALLLPASLADARLLAVPDRLDGALPDDGDLPGALHALPARPRPARHQRPQGVGVRGRRRDGRAGVARRRLARRARAARQPDLRGELQPPAPRRPGARQRQDHPGARGRLPRRRLERDQGDLGRWLGPPARARQARPAAQADGGGARRRLPELQGEGRRLHPRALLREVSAAARDGREPDGRRHLAAQPRRARPAEGLRGLRGGRQAHRSALRDPGQDGQGLRAREDPARA